MIKYLIIFLLALSSINPVMASEEIGTAVNINYQIQSDGSNQVEHQVTLTNKTSSSYATQYTLELNSNRIQDISITDQQGQSIPFESQATETSTILLLQFKDTVVGKGKSRVVNINYSNPDISHKLGNILEINIPKVRQPEKYSSYASNIIVPTSFGKPSLINPSQHQLESDNTITRITFDKNQLSSGALVLFGEEQYYHLKAYISLPNNSITPIETQFALPPDTAYQKVYLNSLNPSPSAIEQDEDGNWIATYLVEAKQNLLIDLDQTIIVYNQPQHQISNNNTDLNHNLKQDEYWETADTLVHDTARQLPTPSKIYDYLVTNFKYNFARIDNQSTHRLGAKQALKNPNNSLCMEFSDSFIAMARVNQIPSRLITGYAHTQNPSLKPLSLVQDSLHAWVEYYDIDSSSWRATDPTWGHTTNGIDYFNSFDFNHIAFSISGKSSESPLPLGYNTNSTPKLDVNFSESKPIEQVKVNYDINTPVTTLLGFTNHLNISIDNQSNIAIYDQALEIESDSNPVGSATIPAVLPLSSTKHQLQLDTSYSSLSSPINLKYYGQNQQININQIPGFTGIIIFAISSGIAIIIAIFTFRSRSVLVSGK